MSPGNYRLRLSTLHCNGADADFDFHLAVDRNGIANLAELHSLWLLQRIETAFVSGEKGAAQLIDPNTIANAPSPAVQTKLRILRDLLRTPKPIDLGKTEARQVSLSDSIWESAVVGWGQLARNHYSSEKGRGTACISNSRASFMTRAYTLTPPPHSVSTWRSAGNPSVRP